MEERKNTLLEDSLARLDAAIGSPGGGLMRTPGSRRRMFPTRGGHPDLDVTSMLEGTLDGAHQSCSSIGPHTSHIGMSLMDSPSIIVEEVTAPIPVLTNETLDATSAALLADDDPGVQATQVLFSEFINVMVSHPAETQVWDELSRYESVCCQQVEALSRLIRKAPKHHANFTRTQQIYKQLLAERNTWRLLGSLYSERKVVEEAEDHQDFSMLEDQNTTDLTVVNRLYDTNHNIREAQMVIDWLERNAADDLIGTFYNRVEFFGNNHIAWENTLKTLKSEKSCLGLPLRGSRALVTSLDPDAVLRQGGRLQDLDQEDEHRLLKCVFAHVRSGQVTVAEELCVKAGQGWQAATFEGWRLFHDPNITDPAQRKPISGNRYRDVWKATAWRAANDDRLPMYERAVYGALCGHLEAMLGVCQDWSDVLWAYSRTMVDQWVEEQLRAAQTHLRQLHPLPKEFPEEKLTMKEVFECLERRPEAQQQKGKNPYYLLQKFLILDDVESLLQETHVWLNDGMSPHLLRCLTHLLLFLRKIGRISQELEPLYTAILEASVKEAIERGDVEQVAWYTSILPPWLQVEWYARFLHNVTDDHHRRHALQLALSAGLDIHSITATVVTNIRASSSSRDPEGEVLAETFTEDRVKIGAIDWLLYYPQQRLEALRQANALMRTFLISRKISATRTLFNKIPSDSINIIVQENTEETGSSELQPHTDNIVREYLCIRTFLDAQESFTDWFDHYHQKRPDAPKKPPPGSSFSHQVAFEQMELQHRSEMERWKRTLSLISKTACDRLYNVLLFPEGGWLVDNSFEDTEAEAAVDGIDGEDGMIRPITPEPDRTHQMSVLRSIYIPQVTSLLQNILHATENYKESVQLADLIASEQHQLYKAFGSSELQRFLMQLQETSKELLDHNCDALGYPLH